MTARPKVVLLISLLLLTTLANAAHYGATFSYGLISKEPDNVHGYQIMFNYDPQMFKWRKFNIIFDGGYSHFWDNTRGYHTKLNIFSAAPIIRYTFKRRGPLLPFLDLSIGLAYLDRTWMEDRNLGIHFSFQDRIGAGAFIGQSEKLSVGFHAVHYSNARLCGHNSGISVPLLIDVAYWF